MQKGEAGYLVKCPNSRGGGGIIRTGRMRGIGKMGGNYRREWGPLNARLSTSLGGVYQTKKNGAIGGIYV